MSVETATELYVRGAFPAALKEALAAANGADQGAALMIVAKCFVALGDYSGLAGVIDFAQKQGAKPELIFFRIVHDCLVDGMTAPLIALDQAIPDGILKPIAVYHASCARMVAGDDTAALDGFDRFRLDLPRFFNALPFGTDDLFNMMFRQGTLVLPPDKTAGRIVEGRGMPRVQTAFEMIKPARCDHEMPAIVCCADARYVAYFLPRWLEAMAGFANPVHAHIINPDDTSVSLVEDLAIKHGLGDRFSASISIDAVATATSYACARFEIVPILLTELGRPLITVDIDVAATAAFEALASLQTGTDFSCFETGRCEPASVHQASIMGFANTPEAISFAQDLSAYCRPKLHQPVRINWMLDQAALFSVIRLYRTTTPDFQYRALDRATGRPMNDYILSLASDEEKHAIKVKSAGLDARADASGKTEVSWEP